MTSNLDQEVKASASAAGTSILTYVPTTTETPDSMTRKWVSYLLLGLLTAVVVAAFAELFLINAYNPVPVTDPVVATKALSDDAVADSDRLMRLMNLVFGPVVTLFSSVVGFYFGARTAKESGNS